MQGSTSKLRNVYGDTHKEKFEDVRPHDTTTEGSLIDANPHFLAVSWSTSGGGCVAVFDAMNFQRLRNDLPLIKGHTGPVTDVKFSPFSSNLLATGSDDATVRLWEIPQGGVTEEGVVEQQKFTGHSKKVGMLNFNPSVAEVIATGSFDNSINVWNICNGQSYFRHAFHDGILSLDWNYNGSLVGLTTKEKLVYVLDPRGTNEILSCKAHESGKSQKMLFLDEHHLFTCGFSKSNERQIKLFDTRKFTESIQTEKVDSQNGIMLPFWDPDTGLIYVPGRGEGNIKYYDYSNGTIKFASEYRSNTQQKGLAFFPKRSMNYNKCEIARFAKLTNNSIEYVSMYFPKRNEGYDPNVYPDCFAGEPALGVEEWIKGENKDPVRKNITTLENKWNISTEMTFEKKSESPKSEEKKSNVEEELHVEISSLKTQLAESNARANELDTEREVLMEKIKGLQIQNDALAKELEELKAKQA